MRRGQFDTEHFFFSESKTEETNEKGSWEDNAQEDEEDEPCSLHKAEAERIWLVTGSITRGEQTLLRTHFSHLQMETSSQRQCEFKQERLDVPSTQETTTLSSSVVPELLQLWPHIWGAHLHLRHLEAGRCWKDWTVDAEHSVIRNKRESTVPAEKSRSEQLTWAEWGSEERSRGKKTSKQVSRDLILSTVNC